MQERIAKTDFPLKTLYSPEKGIVITFYRSGLCMLQRVEENTLVGEISIENVAEQGIQQAILIYEKYFVFQMFGDVRFYTISYNELEDKW